MAAKTPYWQTHLYTYAVSLSLGDLIRPENLAGQRAKAARHHTAAEIEGVELCPWAFMRYGTITAPTPNATSYAAQVTA